MIGFNPLYVAVLALLGPQPALSLDFVNNGYLTSIVNFSRASNATQFDAAGNLVWAPHNLCTRANQFLNWASMGTDGTVTETGRYTNAGNRAAVVTYTVPAPISGISLGLQTVVIGALMSFRVKLGYINHGWVRVGFYSSNNTANQCRCWVNLSNGTLGTVEGSGAGSDVTATLSLDDDGFYIVTVKGRNVWANTTDGNVIVASAMANGVTTRAGNGASFELAEAMLEMGSSAAGQWANAKLTAGTPYYGPRFDYNPASGAALGLLIEESRTNLNPISLDAGTTGITWNGVTSAALESVAGRPMVKATGDGSVTNHMFWGGSLTPAASTVYCVSAIVGQSGTGFVQLATSANFPADPANTYVNVDTSLGSITAVGSAVSASGIVPLGDGRFRVWGTFTTSAAPSLGAAGLICAIPAGNSVRLASFAYSGTWIGGAIQLEQGAFPTSYIPTYGTAATRAQDNVDMPAVVQAAYRATGCTFYTEFSKPALPPSGTGSCAWIFGDPAANYVFGVFGYSSPNTFRVDFVNGGVMQAQVSGVPVVIPGQIYKQASRLAANDARAAANGVLGLADTTVSMPASLGSVRNHIGRSTTGAEYINGHLRAFKVYSVALTDAQLQELTA